MIAIVDVTWGTATMRVLAPADDLEWLAEFLAPAARVTAVSSPGVRRPFHTVEVELVDARPPMQSVPTTRRTLFVRDGANVEAPCGAGELGERIAWVDDGILRVSASGAETTITAWSRRAARHLLFLTVRELLMNELLRTRGGVVLHAAAVTFDGMTMVICGPKAAGKTTLACRVARAGGGLVANDRVALGCGPDFALLAVPTVVTIRPDAAKLLGLHIPWPPAGWQTLRRLAELGPDGVAPPWPDEPAVPEYRWTMSPPQFARVLGRELALSEGDAVLVFPHLDLTDAGPPSARLEPDELASMLRDQFLGRPGARVSDVWAAPGGMNADAVETFLAQEVDAAARCVPGYRLRLGSDWLERPVDELLSLLRTDHPVVSP